MTNPSIRIVLTGGGTGGHTFPLIATARALLELARQNNIQLDLFYFGPDNNSLEIFRKENIKSYKIISAKLNRQISFGHITLPPKLIIGFIQSLWLLLKIMPDAIISKGGYGAVPAVIAGWFYRTPIIIHESDALPGFANKISSVFAKRIAVSFPKAISYFPAKKTILVGNPIRQDLVIKTDQQTAKKILDFNLQKPLLLILGGSQGAEAINNLIIEILPKLIENIQILHQTGEKNIESVRREASFMLKNHPNALFYKAAGFLDEEKYITAIKAADLIVARAGGGTIFEIASNGKPSILIPFPYAASNHQKENAYEYAKYGSAIVIEQNNLLPNLFLSAIFQIIKNPEKIKQMSEAAEKFAKTDAAFILAQEALKLAV